MANESPIFRIKIPILSMWLVYSFLDILTFATISVTKK